MCGLNLAPVSLVSKLLSCERLQLSVREIGEHFLHYLQRGQSSCHGLRGTPDCEGQGSPVLLSQVPQLLGEVRIPRAGTVAAVNILRPAWAETAGEHQQSSQETQQFHHLKSQVSSGGEREIFHVGFLITFYTSFPPDGQCLPNNARPGDRADMTIP